MMLPVWFTGFFLSKHNSYYPSLFHIRFWCCSWGKYKTNWSLSNLRSDDIFHQKSPMDTT